MEQVIVVKLDGIAYGIDVRLVQEVVYSYVERSLPDSPNFIEGLAYVREQLLPIVKTKRLFGSPFFDLHGNKKVLVLSFARMREIRNSGYYDTSAIGVIVDDVVGIESYADEEIRNVPSVYSTSISNEIMGFIEKKGLEIALLNIADFFLDAKGQFKYQKFIHKSTDFDDYKVSREDLTAIEKAVEGVFPFNVLTKRPILVYLSRLALFQETRIERILSENPKFFTENIHTQKHQNNRNFFGNAADIYVIAEYLENQIKAGKQDFSIFVFDSADSTVSESVVLAMESIRKGKTRYEVIHVALDSPSEESHKIYKRENLTAITGENVQKYFRKAEKEDRFSLLPIYTQKIQQESLEQWDISSFSKRADLIYAPNILVSHLENLDQFLDIFTQISKKGSILVLGLFEDAEDFAKSFKKYYIKSRLVFIRE